ncbi:hypothetical protein CH063_10377 [Colletotrichum higginsianum]|uniref:Uncharacterized protein n=1 Tax=Colletotrichum higginsianum (strain IMI 349063) TaxID=759273 RepID=H1VH86_COLHI|nr:hypothetical protein CH063_10377 [Colletotrichum higginsianum]
MGRDIIPSNWFTTSQSAEEVGCSGSHFTSSLFALAKPSPRCLLTSHYTLANGSIKCRSFRPESRGCAQSSVFYSPRSSSLVPTRIRAGTSAPFGYLPGYQRPEAPSRKDARLRNPCLPPLRSGVSPGCPHFPRYEALCKRARKRRDFRVSSRIRHDPRRRKPAKFENLSATCDTQAHRIRGRVAALARLAS